RATIEGLRDYLRQVMIPAETFVEIKGGKKRQTQRNLYPGYVLVQMESDEEKLNDLINLITKIPGVSQFLPGGSHPVPLDENEVNDILNIVQEKTEKPKPQIRYRVGEQVKVIEGPFANFVGEVNEIDEEKSKLKVMVSIFGRQTSVELDVLQVEGV
ncbi:MAG: transcription termination/antitermination protein NusG, partial [Candidatus Sumerlaeaceae bacterium]|nr:transcription termination/antitermination protein NusG [Candidatus Sumerlaeaceae bacterium]